MRIWLWLVLLAGCLPSVSLADTTVDDFAYGIKIDVPAGTAVAAMSMPEQVYESAYRRDLGDVCVFNANGEPVPHMIQYAQTQPTDAPWRSLPLFPLPQEATAEVGGYRVYVRTGPDGAVVRVDPRPTRAPLASARTFLIDLSRVGRGLAQLRLEWRQGEANLMAALAVDASDDLVAWTTIQQRAAISDIRFGGRRLLSNIISLNPSTKRYLRLRQLDSGPAISMVRIDVDNTPLTSAPQGVSISMDRHWRLTVDASDSTIGRAVPQLAVGYRPHDLFFVARGNGPFTLAFGSAAVKPLKVNVAALFDGIGRHRENSLERWVMPQGPPLVLGGPQRLSTLPTPLPMRRIVLWSVLLAGVRVVAAMAWRLARRLKTS